MNSVPSSSATLVESWLAPSWTEPPVESSNFWCCDTPTFGHAKLPRNEQADDPTSLFSQLGSNGLLPSVNDLLNSPNPLCASPEMRRLLSPLGFERHSKDKSSCAAPGDDPMQLGSILCELELLAAAEVAAASTPYATAAAGCDGGQPPPPLAQQSAATAAVTLPAAEAAACGSADDSSERATKRLRADGEFSMKRLDKHRPPLLVSMLKVSKLHPCRAFNNRTVIRQDIIC